MNKAIRLGMTTLLALLGIMFVFNGLNWYINPAAAAEGLGMPLLQGGGLSTQLGDLSSFFLVLGLFVLAGVVRDEESPMVLCARGTPWAGCNWTNARVGRP